MVLPVSTILAQAAPSLAGRINPLDPNALNKILSEVLFGGDAVKVDTSSLGATLYTLAQKLQVGAGLPRVHACV